MNIALSNRIALTTDRSESSYGIPVLIIDSSAFGAGDDYAEPLREALAPQMQEFAMLSLMCTGQQLLTQKCIAHSGYQGEAVAALRLFEGRD